MRIMNAAGDCKYLKDVEELSKTPVDEVTLGSITLDERLGNEGETFAMSLDQLFGLNYRGLPNPGSRYYRETLPEMTRIVRRSGKRLRVSIAGSTIQHYAELTKMVREYADVVEINLGCPNWSGPLLSFRATTMAGILTSVRRAAEHVRCDVKFSPFSDPTALLRAARVAKKTNMNGVVTCNTFPNGIGFSENGKRLLEGVAGVSGRAMKPIALGQVVQFRDALPPEIKVVGVSGIEHGRDVRDFELAGADEVQIGTHFFRFGPRVFQEIAIQYAELS